MYRNHIKEYRQQKGYSLRKLSKITGISPSYLSEIENGIKIPSIAIAYKLCMALKCDVWALFEFR